MKQKSAMSMNTQNKSKLKSQVEKPEKQKWYKKIFSSKKSKSKKNSEEDHLQDQLLYPQQKNQQDPQQRGQSVYQQQEYNLGLQKYQSDFIHKNIVQILNESSIDTSAQNLQNILELQKLVTSIPNIEELDVDMECAQLVLKKINDQIKKVKSIAIQIIDVILQNGNYFPKDALEEIQRNAITSSNNFQFLNSNCIWKIVYKTFCNEKFVNDYVYEQYNPIINTYQDKIKLFFESLTNFDPEFLSQYLANLQIKNPQQDSEDLEQEQDIIFNFCLRTQELFSLLEIVYSNADIFSVYRKNIKEDIEKIFNQKIQTKYAQNNDINSQNYIWLFQANSNQICDMSDNLFKIKIDKTMTNQQIMIAKFKNNMMNFLIDIDSIYTYLKLRNEKQFSIEDLLYLYEEQFQGHDLYSKEQLNQSNIINKTQKNKISPSLYSSYLINLLDVLPLELRQNQLELVLKDLEKHTEQLKDNILLKMSNYKKITYNKLRHYQQITVQIEKMSEKLIKKTHKQNVMKFIQQQQIPIIIKYSESQITLEQNKTVNQVQQLKQNLIFLDQLLPQQQNQNINNKVSLVIDNKPFTIIKCQNIEEFYKSIAKLPIVQSAINLGKYQEQVNACFCQYLDLILQNIKNVFPQEKENLQGTLYKLIEKFITREIKQIAFKDNPSIHDEKLRTTIKSMRFLTYENLDIQDFKQEHDMWIIAAQQLRKIDTEQSPLEQLILIYSVIEKINSVLQLSGFGQSGADNIQPLFIKVLLLANPLRLYTHISLIKTLINANKWKNEKVYYGFTVLQASIEYLNNIDHNTLKITENEFQLLKKESLQGKYNLK